MKKDVLLTVPENYNGELLSFLYETLNTDRSIPRKDVKALLEHYSIVVNGKVRTKYDFHLKSGDTVLVDYNNRYFFLEKHHIRIIYEDREFLVIDKPSGLLSVAAEGKNQPDAYEIMRNYIKASGVKEEIFITHRLDMETSGVLMFSKTKKLTGLLQDDWNELVSERLYYAVAEGVFEKKQGTLISWLRQDKNGMVYSVRNGGEQNQNSKEGKISKAVTEYRVIKENDLLSLLEISINSGRKNQIRIALRDIGHPVFGEKKYNSTPAKDRVLKNPLNRLFLHAFRLTIRNPVSGKILSFELEMPKEFNRVFAVK